MIEDISLPYQDHRAADLVWSLGHAEQPALVDLALDTSFGHIELRVLGSSHQVVLDGPDTQLVETVAALPGHEGGLPRQRQEKLGTGELSYRFNSVVHRPPEFEDAVAALRDDLGRDPRAVLGTFADRPLAATGLRVARSASDELSWVTWHCYPSTGEIVSTATTISR